MTNKNQEMFQEFMEASQAPADQMTLQQLDQLVKELKEARADYDEKAKAKTEANAKCEALENKLMDILQELGRTSYDAEGVAKITRVSKLVYRVPGSLDAKRQLYNYIQSRYGVETLTSMLSINHNTLNSWANKEREDVGIIPGLETPTSVDYLQMRKS